MYLRRLCNKTKKGWPSSTGCDAFTRTGSTCENTKEGLGIGRPTPSSDKTKNTIRHSCVGTEEEPLSELIFRAVSPDLCLVVSTGDNFHFECTGSELWRFTSIRKKSPRFSFSLFQLFPDAAPDPTCRGHDRCYYSLQP